MSKPTTSKAIAGLHEAFREQYLNNRGGYRGKASDMAIYVPRVRANSRDRLVRLPENVTRSIPYWVLNQSEADANNWISVHIGEQHLPFIRDQLASVS